MGVRWRGFTTAAALLSAVAVVVLPASPVSAATFSNPAPIAVGEPLMTSPYIPASPYPSSISVAGLGPSVTDVNVTLCGLSATFPSDVNVLLVAPDGTNAVVMADVGGNGNNEATDPQSDVPVANVTLILDDSAAAPLPADTALGSGTFRPHDDDVGEIDLVGDFGPMPDSDAFPAPAPAASANVALSTFNGVNPNGAWRLYVFDDFPGTAPDGELQAPVFGCGWSLDISTGGGGGTPATRIGVFRPATSTWFFQGGPTTAFGTTRDIPVPGDYDGNGTIDVAVFRPSTGYWFVQGGTIAQFGTNGDIPVPADYDGNGTTDIAVYRPSNGYWFVRNGPVVQFGTTGDIPVPGDYDGNGTDDVAVFRPSTGYWFVQGGTIAQFGTNGDIPVPADYDGNGTTDIAVYRPSTGYWFVRNGPISQFGTSGDIPVPGDYDGNGGASFAVFRPSSGYWFVQGGPVVQFGASGDRPLPLPSAIRMAFFP